MTTAKPSVLAIARKLSGNRSLVHIENRTTIRKKERVAARYGIFAECRAFIAYDGRTLTNSRPW